MIKIENVVLPSKEQWEAVIRGMRNPKNSWDKSDSFKYNVFEEDGTINMQAHLGKNDLKLMKTLVSGGPVHAKFRRMIPIYFDLTAPLSYLKQFDTYRIGVTRNSCSTMHKISAKEFVLEDFSVEHLGPAEIEIIKSTIDVLNYNREKFLETKDKQYWWNMIELLPSSYNQRSTIFLNYEVLCNMYHYRKNHKLDDWHTFCDWIETLPYAKELIIGEKGEDKNGRDN